MGFFSFFNNWVPNEIKDFVSDAVPNEVKPIIDPFEVGTVAEHEKQVAKKEAEKAAAAAVGIAPGGGTPAYDKTLLEAFNAQLAIEPKLLEANKLYQPQWLDLQRQMQATAAKNQMDLMGQLYPQSGQIEAAYQNQLRGNQLQQLQTTLPQYQRAFNALTPGYSTAIENMGQLAQQASQRASYIPALGAYESQVAPLYGNMPSGAQGASYAQSEPALNAYTGRLSNLIQEELSAGRSLTPEEQRIADQSIRSAYAARGTALGQQATTAEVLNRIDLGNQRYQQRLANAQAAAGQIQGIQQNAFQQALQRGQAEQQRLQAGTAIQAGQAQLGAGALGQLQAAQAPALQAYYQQPILQQTVGQAQSMGLANQQASGNSLFQPESSLAFQSAFLPYQSQIALQQSQMQADASKAAGKSAMTGSIIGAAGAAAAAAICWVAREVYGTETGTWKVFRSWLLSDAPEWLRNAYIKYGEQVAEFIKDKPVIKLIIRRWMDSKIESYLTA